MSPLVQRVVWTLGVAGVIILGMVLIDLVVQPEPNWIRWLLGIVAAILVGDVIARRRQRQTQQ